MWRAAFLACVLGLWSADAAPLQLLRSRRSPVYHDCSCICCVVSDPVTKTAPEKQHEKKCLPPPANTGQKCSDMCNTKDSILSTARRDSYGQHLVSYNRFCFLECRPPSCDSPAGEMVQCKPLSPHQVAEAASGDGNGKEIGSDC
mmetsp:Transcript_9464/g.24546  ORF Transcript_9464/g.24546 Transcript_9464/m.24546 type:complete len:145 (-) Transcript_9464:16-450(-)